MDKAKTLPNNEQADAFIDEVRAIRRSMCEEFGNDVKKLGEHLGTIEEEYRSRTGRFARVPRQSNKEIFETVVGSQLSSFGT